MRVPAQLCTPLHLTVGTVLHLSSARWGRKYSKARVGLTDRLSLVLWLHATSGLLGCTTVCWPGPSQSCGTDLCAWGPSLLSSPSPLVWDSEPRVRLCARARALQGEPPSGWPGWAGPCERLWKESLERGLACKPGHLGSGRVAGRSRPPPCLGCHVVSPGH